MVNSSAGKIVTKTELINVFQALDPSLIKSIDVREGDQVEAGQLFATLDQTFAKADAKQLKLQIASLEAQNARDEAELANKPLVFRNLRSRSAQVSGITIGILHPARSPIQSPNQ